MSARLVSTFLLCFIISFPVGWFFREIGIGADNPLLRLVLQVPLVMIGVSLVKVAFKRVGLGYVVGWGQSHD